MPINPAQWAFGLTAFKEALAEDLQAAKDGIEPLILTDANTAITVTAAMFGDRQYLRILCTAATAITVTLAAGALAGRTVELVRKGAGNITAQPSALATMTPTAGTGNWSAGMHSTTDLNECLVYTVDTNSAELNAAAWRQIARP